MNVFALIGNNHGAGPADILYHTSILEIGPERIQIGFILLSF
jgi:hypothetical protein